MKKFLVLAIMSLMSLGSFAAEFDACDILLGVDAVGGALRAEIDNETASADYWRGVLNQRSVTYDALAEELREKANTVRERADDLEDIIEKVYRDLNRAADVLDDEARYYGAGNSSRYYTRKINRLEDSGDNVAEFLVGLTRFVCRRQR